MAADIRLAAAWISFPNPVGNHLKKPCNVGTFPFLLSKSPRSVKINSGLHSQVSISGRGEGEGITYGSFKLWSVEDVGDPQRALTLQDGSSDPQMLEQS